MNLTFLKAALFTFFIIHFTPNSQPVQLTKGKHFDFHLQWSPDVKYLSSVSNRSGKRDIWLIPVEGGEPELLQIEPELDGDFYMSWAEKGKRIVFDAREAGQPHSLFSVSSSGGRANLIEKSGNMPSVSPDCLKIVFMRGGELFIHSKKGIEKYDMIVDASVLWHPNWSPDGKQIVFTAVTDGNHEIMIITLGDKDPVQITDNPAVDDRACWSPDGKMLVFNSDRSGNHDLWLYNIEKKTFKQLTFDESPDLCPTWSPDGNKIAFSSKRDNGNINAWILDVIEY